MQISSLNGLEFYFRKFQSRSHLAGDAVVVGGALRARVGLVGGRHAVRQALPVRVAVVVAPK